MKKYILMSFGILLVFSGCAKNFNVNPNYDEKNKRVFIEDYIIPNISYHSKSHKPIVRSKGKAGKFHQLFKSNNNNCKFIKSVFDYRNGGWYKSTSAKEDVLAINHNKNCIVEEIANISFINCEGKSYWITTSKKNKQPNGDTVRVQVNKECYKSLKKHFKNKLK